MKHKIVFLLINFIISACIVSAQSWVEKFTGNGERNFYEIQEDFNNFLKSVDPDTVRGIKQYKRWEWFMEPRVYPSGQLPSPMAAYEAMEIYKKEYKFDKRSKRSSGDWKLLGPRVPSTGGLGRINFVTFHPTLPKTIFVGAPSGGLWRSDDDGATWTTLTDTFSVIGFSDLAINPLNPDVMYLASSDGDAYDTYSLGVLKSYDGGNSWYMTGLNWQVTQARRVRKLKMHPNDTSIIFAATSTGLYKSENGGSGWSVKLTGHIKDIEFKPGNPNIVFATTYGYSGAAAFYRSVDGGNSFTKITNGLPTSSTVRFEIAVTPADTDLVYVVVAKPPNTSSLEGFYVSNDGGLTFSQKTNIPNLLGRATTGSDNTVGQGWYDLAVIASPTNKNEIYVGGINIWKSSDGGDNWSLSAHWTGSGGAAYVHADIHALEFYPGSSSTFYVGSDGGVQKSTDNGVTYTDLSSGMAISQIYRLGISSSNPDLILVGLQDNGTKRLKNTDWDDVNSGDGFECIIDYQDNSYMYSATQYGNLYRSSNGGNSFQYISGSISETGGWLTPYAMDPFDPQTLYAAYVNIWKTTNRGASWTQISSFSGTQTFDDIKVAPSNSDVIYAAKEQRLYRTTDGGANWAEVALGLPSLAITYIAIHPQNPDSLWVTLSGYTNGEKVYLSPDGGSTWKNFSGNLPNIPANCIVYQNDSPDALYVGTDVGVYYRDNTLQNWIPYSSGLPNVIVNELEILYDEVSANQKIRAATYGRGLWESELYFSPDTPPYADFEAADSHVCVGYTVAYENLSSYGTSYEWYFSGGTPSYSTEKDPRVVYNTQGTFDVKLIVYNDNGSDSVVRSAYINIDPALECVYVMPEEPNNNVYYSCTGRLYDPGGKYAYSNNTNTYVSIAPYGADKLAIRFNTFSTEEDADSISFYEGIGLTGRNLGNYSGAELPEGGFIIFDTSVVTIRMISNSGITKQGFELDWHCVMNDQSPFVFAYVNEDYTCTGTLQFTGTAVNSPDNWYWDFGDGSTSTDQNPVHTYGQSGDYDVWLKADNSFGTDSFSISQITVDLPTPPVTFPASRCGSGELVLRAEGTGTIKWYSDAEGTQLVNTGEEYTVNISSDQSFYVRRFTNGQAVETGHDLTKATPGAFASSKNGVYFDVLKPLTIKSFTVYSEASDYKTFAILDAAGDTVWSQRIQLPTKDKKVAVNVNLDAGSNYSLVAILNSGLWYSNGIGQYPYVLDGLISITKSLTSDNNYYYFYDVEVEEAEVCKSQIIPIEAAVFSTAPDANFSYLDSSLRVQFYDQSTDPFFYQWSFGDGDSSTEKNPLHLYTNDGSYTVTLVVDNGCGTDSISQSISIVNAINDLTGNALLKIYPNPNDGNFVIEDNGFGLNKILLTSIDGKVIKAIENVSTNKLSFNLNYPKGVYLMKMFSDKEVVYKRIIIQ